MGSLNQLKSSATGHKFPVKGTGQGTTLTRRAAGGGAQFSETNPGGLLTEDRVDVLEESGPDDPGGVASTLANTRAGVQIEDSTGTNR